MSCALWLASAGPMTLGEIGLHFGCTRQRVEQIVPAALARLGRHIAWAGDTFADLVPEHAQPSCQGGEGESDDAEAA